MSIAERLARLHKAAVRWASAIRKRDIRNGLRLAQPGDLAQYLARCQINHAEAVVAELGNKQPLSLQIDAEVIDAALTCPSGIFVSSTRGGLAV